MTVGGRSRDGKAVIAKYSISGNNWTDEVLPEGMVPKKRFKEGASLVYAQELFVSVGGTFDLLKRADGIWSKVTNIPVAKKFKGDIVYNPYDNSIYANEGNKVANFSCYSITNGAWQSLPAWPSGREERNPKDIALTCSDGIIYALKGNNTRGFWEYLPIGPLVNNLTQNLEEGVQSYLKGRSEADKKSRR